MCERKLCLMSKLHN
uniref:Uncharacterized protein n=1 Tax=Arundo donax TaxID=35708 RepID=A0A0A9BI31_ARUDO